MEYRSSDLASSAGRAPPQWSWSRSWRPTDLSSGAAGSLLAVPTSLGDMNKLWSAFGL